MARRIDRRAFLRTSGIAPAALALARWGHAAEPAQRPNILFIMSDDHASHAMSCYGSRINQTPNLDRLAREGMRFDNCFCTNSICAPSRAVILTGKYSHLNGVIDNGKTFDGSQQTFPKLLQPAGYQTAMIGKWHLKSDPTGFDYWNILPGQGAYHNPVLIEMGEQAQHEGYVTDIITDLTLDWLREGRDAAKPFLLMCHHKAPHRRWEPDEKHASMYEDVDIPLPPTFDDDYNTRSDAAREQKMSILHDLTKNDLKGAEPPPDLPEQALKEWKYQRYIKDYLRCVASVDDNVGRLLTYLDEAGLTQNTLVLYTSDQGFYLGDHGWFDKRFMYEESLRMPLLARYPGVIPAGATNDDIVLNLDFAPTFLDLAAIEKPDDMQGESMAPLLSGQTPGDWRTSMYYHYYEYPAVHSVKRHYGVRTKRHKLIHFYYDIDAWELYDLENDPHELSNIYDDPANAALVAELKAELKRLQELYADDTAAEVIGTRHPDFDRVIAAQVADSDLGYDITSGLQGFALKKLPQTFSRRLVLRCRLKTLRTDGTRNGLICFGPDADPDDLLKCGVYIGVGEAVILHGRFGGPEEEIVRQPVSGEKDKVFDVTVEADLEARSVKLTVDDTEVTAEIRKGWSEVNYVGYLVNYTATAFSKLEIEGE